MSRLDAAQADNMNLIETVRAQRQQVARLRRAFEMISQDISACDASFDTDAMSWTEEAVAMDHELRET